MSSLNFNHLRYFRAVALDGQLTRAAETLNLSQSALSVQIKTLEQRLGHPLFERVGRQLVLTEAGQIALTYADRIFGAGDQLLQELSASTETSRPLRVGAVSTLSRNFQMQFLKPVLDVGRDDFVLQAGRRRDLLAALQALKLDVVLSTEPPYADQMDGLSMRSVLLAAQAVKAHGHAHRLDYGTLEDMLSNEPIILPTESVIRDSFDALVARLNVSPRIAAEVDDMAMVRLLARNDAGIAIAPSVVVGDELASGGLATAAFDLAITEAFYATTVERAFPHPALERLLETRTP
ncbi:MAG: LysR family transcriptional regulator [Pseudomonadota bacterium]